MDALEIDRAMLVGHSFGGVIAMHAAVLHPGPDRGGRPLRPVLPRAAAPGGREPLGPLAELPRGGRRRRASRFRMSTGTTWAEFFDQVLHLDGERLCGSARPSACPGFNRLLRLAETTCGDDAKAEAGLTEDLIRGVTQPVLALFGEHSPFLATADYLAEHLPHCVNHPRARRQAPRTRGERPRVRRAVSTSSCMASSRRLRWRGPTDERPDPTVLLTGAAHGIGRATAMALAPAGHAAWA